jgi:Flp pilus assembly secretin CpaC
MRTVTSFITTFSVLFGVLIGTSAHAQAVSLEVDQAKPLHFNAPITGVVVGNAGIADVIVHDSKTLFVIGKSVGSTHVLAVDQRGRTVFSGSVAVRASAPEGLLTVQRGRELTTSLCDTRCIAYAHSESGMQGMSDAVGRASARSAFAGGSPK